jgi:hypothetical protein
MSLVFDGDWQNTWHKLHRSPEAGQAPVMLKNITAKAKKIVGI